MYMYVQMTTNITERPTLSKPIKNNYIERDQSSYCQFCHTFHINLNSKVKTGNKSFKFLGYFQYNISK